jgi:hypothetical protein
MKPFHVLLWVFPGAVVFGAAPWELDPDSYRALKAVLEAKHHERVDQCRAQQIGYCVDYCSSVGINPSPSSCRYCQSGGLEAADLERQLTEAGFQKIQRKYTVPGHCFGCCILFLKYMRAHPVSFLDSCIEIVSGMAKAPRFLHDLCMFSANQPYDYQEEGASAPPGDLGNPMHLKPSAMKRFLAVILQKNPEDYLFLSSSQADPSRLDAVAIYATLQKFPNKLLLVSYTNKHGFHHSLAISTYPAKLFLFDPSRGLFHFPNLETMSWHSGILLQGCKFRWMASFSKDLPTPFE